MLSPVLDRTISVNTTISIHEYPATKSELMDSADSCWIRRTKDLACPMLIGSGLLPTLLFTRAVTELHRPSGSSTHYIR